MNGPQRHGKPVTSRDGKADDLSRLSIPALVSEYFITYERSHYELCSDDAGDAVSPAQEHNRAIQDALAMRAPATLRDSAELIRFMRHQLVRYQADAAEIFPEGRVRGQHELLGRVYLQVVSAANRRRQERQDAATAKQAAQATKPAPSAKPVAAKPTKATKPAPSGKPAAAKPTKVAKPAGGIRRVDVMLTEVGDRKINVIKQVHEITALGLKESKDLVEGAPKRVMTNCTKTQAKDLEAKLKAAGATVELVPANEMLPPPT